MKNLLLISMFILVGCGQQCNETLKGTNDDSKPNLLIVGDSISRGYKPFIAEGMPDYNVLRPWCNCRNSANGVANIDFWLSQRDFFEIIIFNHGIWDAKYQYKISPEGYESNLRVMAVTIKTKTNRPYFVLTTKVDAGTPDIDDSVIDSLNEIAIRVMDEEGIPVIDLNTKSKQLKRKDRVHYSKENSRELANIIINEIN